MSEANIAPSKACSKCGAAKPQTEKFFRRNSGMKSGFLNACHDCETAYRNRPEIKERRAKWRSENAERRREYHRRYCREWYARSPKKRVCHSISVLMNRSIKGGKNGWSWERLVGYTRSDLVSHIEKQFTRGMTWENYGEWHIDHIVPIASFSFDRPQDPEFATCWALTNLRPLWGPLNCAKGGERTLLL